MVSQTAELVAASLPLTGVTAALQVTEQRCALELFLDDGSLLFVTASSSLDPAGVRGAWRLGRAETATVLVVGTTGPVDRLLPLLNFEHRGRQISADVRRLGPFWLAEATGRAVTITVDDGRVRTTGRARRRPGSLRLRSAHSKLRNP